MGWQAVEINQSESIGALVLGLLKVIMQVLSWAS